MLPTNEHLSTLGILTFEAKPDVLNAESILNTNTCAPAESKSICIPESCGHQIILEVVPQAPAFAPEVIMTKVKKDKTLPDGTFKKGGVYTTVKWNDGTYTTVKASADDELESSPYMAFCAALAKKLYGTNSAVHRMVTRHTAEYLEVEKKKAAAEKRAKERAAEQASHERALLREAKRLRLKEEAKAYNKAHKMDEE